jgi:serine/threonine protein kinase
MGNQCQTKSQVYFSKEEELYYRQKLSEEMKLSKLKPARKPVNCRELSGFVGRGNSEVKKVIDLSTNEIFAVKLLRCSVGSADPFSDIEKEANILAELNHENIVTFHGAVFDKGYLKIYMEYVDGGSIHSLIKSTGPLDAKVAANFTRQICHGLEYLHSHKIIHRDIKCANVLVDRHGKVKLTDFGCAKEVLSVTESYYGTSGFIAPEVPLLDYYERTI